MCRDNLWSLRRIKSDIHSWTCSRLTRDDSFLFSVFTSRNVLVEESDLPEFFFCCCCQWYVMNWWKDICRYPVMWSKLKQKANKEIRKKIHSWNFWKIKIIKITEHRLMFSWQADACALSTGRKKNEFTISTGWYASAVVGWSEIKWYYVFLWKIQRLAGFWQCELRLISLRKISLNI